MGDRKRAVESLALDLPLFRFHTLDVSRSRTVTKALLAAPRSLLLDEELSLFVPCTRSAPFLLISVNARVRLKFSDVMHRDRSAKNKKKLLENGAQTNGAEFDIFLKWHTTKQRDEKREQWSNRRNVRFESE